MMRFILPFIYSLVYSIIIAPGGGVKAKMLQYAANGVGGGTLTADEFGNLTLIMFVYSALLGNLADIILKESGFGPNRNGVISLFGAVLGLSLFSTFGGKIAAMSHMEVLIIAIVAVSTVTLVLACVVRQIVQDETVSFFTGSSAMFKPKPALASSSGSIRMQQMLNK